MPRKPARLPVCLAVALLSLSSATSSVFAQEPSLDASSIRWFETLAPAAAEANSKKMPIAAFFYDAKAEGGEGLAKALADQRVAKSLERFACIIASPHRHEDPNHRLRCGRFGTRNCRKHQRTWEKLSFALSGSPLPTPGTVVILDQKRRELKRRVGISSANDLLVLLDRAHTLWSNGGASQMVKQSDLARLEEQVRGNRPTIRQPAISRLVSIEDPRAMDLVKRQLGAGAGEVQRQEAIKAMKDQMRAEHLPLVIPLLGESSGQLQRNAVFALRNLGMREAVPPLLKHYGRANTNRMRSLILRTVAVMDPENPKTLEIHAKAMRSGPPMLRVHAIMACLDLDLRPREFIALVDLSQAATSMKIQLLACFASTEILLRSKESQTVEEDDEDWEDDGYERTRVSRFAKDIQKHEKRLGGVLRELARAGRNEEVREYAAACVEALDGESERFRELILRYHQDARDEVFREY